MSVDRMGDWSARCDFGFKSRDEAGCGERITLGAANATRFVQGLRRQGWTLARTTDEALIRYAEKPISYTEEQWAIIKPTSIYTARCPEHAGRR